MCVLNLVTPYLDFFLFFFFFLKTKSHYVALAGLELDM